MKLGELLSITGVGTVVKVDGIANRKRSSITKITCVNEYGITEGYKMDEAIKNYGEYEIINQSVEDNELIVLVRL